MPRLERRIHVALQQKCDLFEVARTKRKFEYGQDIYRLGNGAFPSVKACQVRVNPNLMSGYAAKGVKIEWVLAFIDISPLKVIDHFLTP